MTARHPYPSDLTAAQWDRIEPHVPKPKSFGRPASVDRREIVNAIFYVVRAGIIDGQSVKTVEQPAICRGYDGGKRVKGRKRHLAVDTLNLLLVVVVTAANVGDQTGARLAAGGLVGRFVRLVTRFADAGYRSQPLSDLL